MAFFLVKVCSAIFDSLRSKTIKLEGRINLDDRFDELIGIVEQILSSTAKDTVVIDLRKAEFIYPSALVLLLSLKEALEERGAGLNLRIELGTPVHEYLLFCGCDQYFSIPSLPKEYVRTIQDEKSVLKLLSGGRLPDPGKIAHETVDMLSQRQPLSRKVEADAIDSILELLMNTDQHSEYSRYYFLGQAYPRSQRIRFVLYDNGIGIRAHLTHGNYSERHDAFKEIVSENQYAAMRTGDASLAIETSAAYMVSGTNYSNNSGAGLHFLIRELGSATEGIVSIISEDGFVQWKAGEVVARRALKSPLKGTLVSVTINCDADSILIYQDELRGGS